MQFVNQKLLVVLLYRFILQTLSFVRRVGQHCILFDYIVDRSDKHTQIHNMKHIAMEMIGALGTQIPAVSSLIEVINDGIVQIEQAVNPSTSYGKAALAYSICVLCAMIVTMFADNVAAYMLATGILKNKLDQLYGAGFCDNHPQDRAFMATLCKSISVIRGNGTLLGNAPNFLFKLIKLISIKSTKEGTIMKTPKESLERSNEAYPLSQSFFRKNPFASKINTLLTTMSMLCGLGQLKNMDGKGMSYATNNTDIPNSHKH